MTGEAAEYRAGIETCPDCGADLVDELPPSPSSPRTASAWPRSLVRQLVVTALLLGGLFLATLLPNPLQPFLPAGFPGDTGQLEDSTQPLVLGVRPFFSSFVIVEIVALVIPALRRRRLGDRSLRRKLWIASLAGGLLLALIQSHGIATYLGALQTWDDPGGLSASGFGPVGILLCLVMTTGTALFAVAAGLIDRFGIGRGFGVVLLAGTLFDLPGAMSRVTTALGTGVISLASLLVEIAMIVGFVLAFRQFFRLGDQLTRGRSFAVPTCGDFPMEIGLVVVMIPTTLANFLPDLGPVSYLAALLSERSAPNVVLQCVIIAAFAIPMSAAFYWRRRHGFASGDDSAAWRNARWTSAAFLVAAVIAENVAIRVFGLPTGYIYPGVWTLLVIYALAADWLKEVRAHRLAPEGKCFTVAEYQDVSDALTGLELCREGSPDARVELLGLRFRSVMYFFGPYVPMRIVSDMKLAEPDIGFDRDAAALGFSADDVQAPEPKDPGDPYSPPRVL